MSINRRSIAAALLFSTLVLVSPAMAVPPATPSPAALVTLAQADQQQRSSSRSNRGIIKLAIFGVFGVIALGSAAVKKLSNRK